MHLLQWYEKNKAWTFQKDHKFIFRYAKNPEHTQIKTVVAFYAQN